MTQNYLNILSKNKELKEEDKNFYKAMVLIKEFGYDICNPSNVQLGVETPRGKADYVLQNDNLVINLSVGKKAFIDCGVAHKLDREGRVIVYLSVNGNNANVDCDYLGIHKQSRLNKLSNELKFLYNTDEGESELNEIKDHINDDINELNALLMCIYTGRISQGFMDLMGVTDSKAFADNFYEALERMKMERFTRLVQISVAKDSDTYKWWGEQ